MFNAYKGKQKFLLRSKGDHSAEREVEIINQCFNMIYNEFKKNAYIPRVTEKPKPNYANHTKDNFLETLAN